MENGTVTAQAQKHEPQSPDGAERARAQAVYAPRVDIIDSKDALHLVADVPGADENDTEISLEKNVLTIRASVRPPNLEGYTAVETEYGIGDFERSFTISNEIDREGIEATVRDGVLRVRLPKAKHAGAQKISVRAG